MPLLHSPGGTHKIQIRQNQWRHKPTQRLFAVAAQRIPRTDCRAHHSCRHNPDTLDSRHIAVPDLSTAESQRKESFDRASWWR